MGDLVALRLSEALVTILESSLPRNMPASRIISAIWLWVRTISSKRPWNSERGISRIGSSGGTISALGDVPKVFILLLNKHNLFIDSIAKICIGEIRCMNEQ
jgi:hypothetical protein